jgi:amino acid adenylation domain-containing protein
LAQRPFAPPRGEAEACMAGLWQELLDVPRVGRDDHFFELGGHSLLAMQLVARVRGAFGCELRLEDLFRQPVLAQLTSLVMGGDGPAGTPLEPVAADVPGVLSWAQQRLWFLSRFDPAAQTSYHIPAGFLIRGTLARDALRAALDGVVARHASLRSRFPAAADGTPLAIVEPAGTCAFEESDLSHLAGHELDFALDQKRLDEETRPFDLATGPLIRVQLVRTGPDAHILLITQHHIVSDGWSVGLLWQETLALYEAALAGRPDPLPALPLQYGDYAHWQQRKLARDGAAPDLAYWRAQLAGAPELLTLPTDRPRPAKADHAGALYVLRLPAALTARLRALARRHDATLFMVLLGAWAALLARLSGQPEVVIGTAMANRTRVETEPLIGFFVNTLALRIRGGEALDLPALLAHVRTTTLDGFAHQDVPFEQVVEAVNPPRSLSYPPLFQTMFTVNNAAVDVSAAAARAGLQVEHLPRRLVTARFDLALAISEHDADLCATFEYATALFDGATVARFAACYEHLLGAMADMPATPVNRLPLLSNAEYAALLAAHGRGAPAAPYRPLQRMVEACAERAPTAPALDWQGAQVSYGTLNERANRLAHWLIGQALGAEARVGICTDRGPDMVVALLAVLKAGAAYVPLDPDYPAERLSFMQRDAGLALVLTQQALEQRCAPARRVLLDDALAPWTTAPAHDPVSVPDPRQLAYLIYTSGSTGTPKAALLEHGGLSQLVQAQAKLFQVDAASRMLQFASLSFDAATAEIGVALAAGACLVLAERAAIAPGPTLAGFLRNRGVTHATLPPTVLALTDPAGLDALRVVAVAGEACPPDVVERWAPGRRMLNAYGPSETTVCASVAVLEPDTDPIPLGQPLDGVQLYVLDAAGQPVAPGEPGELYVGGLAVGRGYLRRAALTAERFVPDPFGPMPGARLYRTGDRARWLGDGRLIYLGRADGQLKLRGLRIEPGEVEVALRRASGAAAAAVVVRQDGGEAQLVAYLAGLAGDPAPSELREQLARSLPAYMIPAAFVRLDVLPLTPNGKLDRSALPAPAAHARAAAVYAAPRGTLEEELASLWAELLGVSRIGRNDSFFDLGGSSLLVLRLHSQLLARYGSRVGVADLFTHTTVAALARLLEQGDDSARWEAAAERGDSRRRRRAAARSHS